MSDYYDSIIGGRTLLPDRELQDFESLIAAMRNWEFFKMVVESTAGGAVGQNIREFGNAIVQLEIVLQRLGLPVDIKLTDDIRDRILEEINPSTETEL